MGGNGRQVIETAWSLSGEQLEYRDTVQNGRSRASKGVSEEIVLASQSPNNANGKREDAKNDEKFYHHRQNKSVHM